MHTAVSGKDAPLLIAAHLPSRTADVFHGRSQRGSESAVSVEARNASGRRTDVARLVFKKYDKNKASVPVPAALHLRLPG